MSTPVKVTPRTTYPSSPGRAPTQLTEALTAPQTQGIGGIPNAPAAQGTPYTFRDRLKDSPWLFPMLATAGKQIYRAISPDRQAEIYANVLESQINYRNTLLQRAYGHFTPADVQDIQRSAEPAVNAIAQGVSARGLGTSGAGAQIIAEAQQRPFTQAQQQAQAQLPQWDIMIMQNAKALMGDPSFFSDIDSIVQLLIEEFDEDPETKENDPEFKEMITALFTFFRKTGAF